MTTTETFAREVAQVLDEHAEASGETSDVDDISWKDNVVTVKVGDETFDLTVTRQATG